MESPTRPSFLPVHAVYYMNGTCYSNRQGVLYDNNEYAFAMKRSAASLASLLCFVLLLTACSRDGGGENARQKVPGNLGPPRNVVLFIGDGMGFEHVKAAGTYLSGSSGTLSFEGLPHRASMSTQEIYGGVTDSAASATAMAAGVKVKPGVISVALPGSGADLKSVLEYFKEQDKSAGLVSTTFITHATPAAFGAHEPDRDNYTGIAADYLASSRHEVLMGGAKFVSPEDAINAGYAVMSDRAALLALDTEGASRLWGQFGRDHMPFELDGLGDLPHLSEMTRAALNILDNDPEGFFLMVEGGRIDHAAHAGDIARCIGETLEFADAVQEAIDWARGRTDTLILVTADHETGGLTVTGNNGRGVLPDVSWATTGHTLRKVPVYAWGAKAQAVRGTIDNTDIFEIIMERMPAVIP